MFVSLVDRLVDEGYKKCVIAERIGMSPQRLSNVLNGHGTISEKVLEKLVSVFKLGRLELVLKEPRQNGRRLPEGDARSFDEPKDLDELFNFW